jgi:hypothetical protein
MKTTKVAEEMSRLINDTSRKFRNRPDPPSAPELVGLSKLAVAFGDLVQAENAGKNRDMGRGQRGGYEGLQAMHEKIAMKKLIHENRDPEDEYNNCEN